jgi:hypothetical protein
VADRHVALEGGERRLVEDLRDEAHVLVDEDLPAVADGDTGGLLAAVLQRVQPEVRQLRDLFAGCPDPEDPAGVLWPAVVWVKVIGKSPITARHSSSLRR